MIELVEGIAKARKDPRLPREFIERALDLVDSGEEDVQKYPTGAPSAKGIYEIASRLHRESLK